MKISSAHNPRFRAALALKSSRGRRRAGKIIVYGVREVERFLNAYPQASAELFVCPEAIDLDGAGLSSTLAGAERISWLEIDRKLMQILSFGDRLDGVVLVATRPGTSLENLSIDEPSLVVVAESLEKPGNLGALARVCDGGGVTALICTDPHTDVFHPNAIRASLGCVFALPIATESSPATRSWLERHEFKIFPATPDANATIYTDCDLTGRAAIVLGGEATGLSPTWLGSPGQSSSQAVRLPMQGLADSLNISTAAAVLIYESLRQRTLSRQESQRNKTQG